MLDLSPDEVKVSLEPKPTHSKSDSYTLDSDEYIFVTPMKKWKRHISLLNSDLVSDPLTKEEAPKLLTVPSTPLSENSVSKILDSCRQRVKRQKFDLTVNRKTVLLDLFKVVDSMEMLSVSVTFNSENGVGSGLIKDVFSIALHMMKENYLLEGDDCNKTLKKHKPSLQQGLYEKMGQVCALSMVHGGPAPSFFSTAFAASVLRMEHRPSVDDILNQNIKAEIMNTLRAKTVFDANRIMAECSIFECAGTHVQVQLLDTSQENPEIPSREKAVNDAVEYMVRTRIEDETAAFAKGLDKHFNLLTQLKTIPREGIKLFVHSERDYVLTAESLLVLFSVTEEVEKSRVYSYFVRYLQDIENPTNSNIQHTLNEVLFFTCGVTSVPPLGFGLCTPKLSTANIYFPKSGICFNEVQLPNLVEGYEEFIVVMDTALVSDELSD